MQRCTVTTVVLSGEDTLVDARAAIESVVYELARHNGESPLDRGAALAREVISMGAFGLRSAFEQLALKHGWRHEESGEESVSRVAFLARPYPDALAAVALAATTGYRLIALSHGDPRLTRFALRPFGDAIADVSVPDRLTCGSESLVVSTWRPVLRYARAQGARAVWLDRDRGSQDRRPARGWPSLASLPRCLGIDVASCPA